MPEKVNIKIAQSIVILHNLLSKYNEKSGSGGLFFAHNLAL
jgi:hypothetical protein